MNQGERILLYLAEKGPLTTFEAFTELHITKLGTRISELRREGYDIADKVISRKNAEGNASVFKQYRLRSDEDREFIKKKYGKESKA